MQQKNYYKKVTIYRKICQAVFNIFVSMAARKMSFDDILPKWCNSRTGKEEIGQMKSGTILLGIGCGIRVACIRILASSKAFGNALQRMDSILDHFQMRKKQEENKNR